MAGGCNDVENLSIPKSLRTGTGAIRQESFMLSQLSAPQAESVLENSFLQSARPTLREIRPKISQRSPLRLLISEQISRKL